MTDLTNPLDIFDSVDGYSVCTLCTPLQLVHAGQLDAHAAIVHGLTTPDATDPANGGANTSAGGNVIPGPAPDPAAAAASADAEQLAQLAQHEADEAARDQAAADQETADAAALTALAGAQHIGTEPDDQAAATEPATTDPAATAPDAQGAPAAEATPGSSDGTDATTAEAVEPGVAPSEPGVEGTEPPATPGSGSPFTDTQGA